MQTRPRNTDPLASALVAKERDGLPGSAVGRTLAAGRGWRVVDVLCTCGPPDLPFEERYWSVAVSFVLSGAFSYRTSHGSVLMSPGAWLLGNVESVYECSHEHGQGDRCLSFQFDPALFGEIARDTGVRSARFGSSRIPPIRETAPLAARAISALDGNGSFEELAVEVAACAIRITSDMSDMEMTASARDRSRIVEVLQHLEHKPPGCDRLEDLARIAGFSTYHFLRVFKAVTGITPHQWLMRARLREAAHRLAHGGQAVTDIAFDVGFEDLSNFIRSFRSEFGMPPGRYRSGLLSRRPNRAQEPRTIAS